jgi:phosphoserine phosphatase
LSAIGRQRTNAEPGYDLVGLDEAGGEAVELGSKAGLVAATSRYGGPPVWVVTGGSEEAVQAAAEALDAEQLRDHYAVAVEGGKVTPLPLEKP